jgi:deazaflavin-dependent oxidoreductase (nitroreductase family)
MRSFDEAVMKAARNEREIDLTTFGRVTNKPSRVTVWITPLEDSLYLRSGGGMGRDWTKNLAAHGKGILHLGGADVPFTARHVTDLAEAKAVSRACAEKYDTNIVMSDDDTPTPAETATFQLFPVEE